MHTQHHPSRYIWRWWWWWGFRIVLIRLHTHSPYNETHMAGALSEDTLSWRIRETIKGTVSASSILIEGGPKRGTRDEVYGGRRMVKEGERAEINIHKTARKGRGRGTLLPSPSPKPPISADAPLSFISRLTVIILSPPASPLQLRSARTQIKTIDTTGWRGVNRGAEEERYLSLPTGSCATEIQHRRTR